VLEEYHILENLIIIQTAYSQIKRETKQHIPKLLVEQVLHWKGGDGHESLKVSVKVDRQQSKK